MNRNKILRFNSAYDMITVVVIYQIKENYNYNKLWKLLIDRKITKTETRLQAGISTNMLAKMGKDEPVSWKHLQK